MMLTRANPTKGIVDLGGFSIKEGFPTIAKHFASKANVAFWTILLFFPQPIEYSVIKILLSKETSEYFYKPVARNAH